MLQFKNISIFGPAFLMLAFLFLGFNTQAAPIDAFQTCAGNHPPELRFRPQEVRAEPGETINFAAQAADADGDDIWYLWAVNQLGLNHEGSEFSFTTPSEPGMYVVTVLAADRCDYTIKWTYVNTIGANPYICTDDNLTPLPVIEAQHLVVPLGQSIELTSLATDPEGGEVWHAWAVNELGLAGEGRHFNFKPDRPGEYIVTLTTGDKCSYESTWTNVTVIGDSEDMCLYNNAPHPVIYPKNPQVVVGEKLTFDAAHSGDRDGDPLFYFWAVNQLEIEQAGGVTFDFAPQSPGEYIVTLLAADQCTYNVDWTSVQVNVDPTPRISYWWGKVNQHTESGIWVTDPDGTSGANLDKLAYCQKWYPETTTVEEYKLETITTWKAAGNTGNYTSTRMSYECVQTNDK